MTFFQETLIIWRAELARAMRSGRVVVLLALYALFSLLSLLAISGLLRLVRSQIAGEAGNDPAAAAAFEAALQEGLLGFLVGEAAAGSATMQALPIVVLAVFRLTLFFLPAYVALVGFDQISGEVGPRSFRYLAVRSRRASVLAGKFLAQAALLVGLVLIIDLFIVVWALVSEPAFTLGTAIPGLVKLWLAATLFSLAYLGLTTLCSTLARSPAVSLALNFLLLFAFWLADAVGSGRVAIAQAQGVDPPFSALIRYLSPSHYASGLLNPDLQVAGVSALAYALFATGFLLLALLALNTRDV